VAALFPLQYGGMFLLQKLSFGGGTRPVRVGFLGVCSRQQLVIPELSQTEKNDANDHNHHQGGCAHQKIELSSPISERSGDGLGSRYDERIMRKPMGDDQSVLTVDQ